MLWPNLWPCPACVLVRSCVKGGCIPVDSVAVPLLMSLQSIPIFLINFSSHPGNQRKCGE